LIKLSLRACRAVVRGASRTGIDWHFGEGGPGIFV